MASLKCQHNLDFGSNNKLRGIEEEAKALVKELRYYLLDILRDEYKEGFTFKENFTDNSNEWLIANTSEYNFEIKRGKYIMENKQDKLNTKSTLRFPLKKQDNYHIELTIEKLIGEATTLYGITWGMLTNYYLFSIKDSGTFAVLKYEKEWYWLQGDTWQKQSNLTASSSIKKPNAINKLSIVKSNNGVRFSINDKPVLTSTGNFELFGDRIGIYLDSGVKVAVREFSVSNR